MLVRCVCSIYNPPGEEDGTDLTGFTKRGVYTSDMKVPGWDDSGLFPKEFGGKRLESWAGAPVKRTLCTEEFGL